MDKYESLSPTKWECKYHVVFIPKCRRQVLYEQLRRHLGEVFHQLARQKESRIEEGHLMSDHVHMMIAIPPKYAVSEVTSRSAEGLVVIMDFSSELTTFLFRCHTVSSVQPLAPTTPSLPGVRCVADTDSGTPDRLATHFTKCTDA